MVRSQLDHLVIAAAALDVGVSHVEQALGVALPFGGNHPLMGTYNCLMRLGETCFLEIIAIDPEAPTPPYPRWFGLDDPAIQERITACPCLLTWVCRTPDLAATTAAAAIDTGPIREGRRGELVWHITIPEDGSMPLGGLFPTLIQWPESLGENGPAPRIADLGCRLEKLELTSPDAERLEAGLASIGFDGPAVISTSKEPALTAHIATKNGQRMLR